MFLPAAEVITETRALAEEFAAQLNAYAGGAGGLLLERAEERGELDDPLWPAVMLRDAYLRRLDWDRLPAARRPSADGSDAGGGG